MYGEFFILQNGDMSESSLVSDTIDLVGITTFKIITYWQDGTAPLGVLSLEATTNNGVTYDTLLESEQSISDDDGFHIWHFPYNPITQIRARYLRTSGTGTMTIFIQVGGPDL